MVVYGGRVDDFHYLGDVYELSRVRASPSRSWKWKKLFPLNKEEEQAMDATIEDTVPKPRNHHSAAFYKGSMYVYGGRSEYQSYRAHGTVWVFNLESNTWSSYLSESVGVSSRIEHCASIVGSKLVVFAGQDSLGKRLNDLLVLDVEAVSKQLPTMDPGSTPMSFDASVDPWMVLEDSNCRYLATTGFGINLAFYLGVGVLIIGFMLIWYRYRQSSRHLGYRRLG